MAMAIQVTSNLPRTIQALKQTATARMVEATHAVRTQTLETLTGKRTGRRYRIPGSIRTYIASAPGEPPAQRLGELRQSIKTEVEGKGENIVGRVGTEKDSGAMLEVGTKNIAARPWLRVSFEKSEDRVREIFSRIWPTH